MKKKIWFKAKRYGWGWHPATWQGWTVMLVLLALYVVAFLQAMKAAEQGRMHAFWIGITFALVCLFFLIFISYKKGEPPRWRWG